jgi:hypothetical protein
MDSEAHILYRQSKTNVIGANSGLRAALYRLRRMHGGWLRTQSSLILQAADIRDFPDAVRLARFTWRDRLILASRAAMFRRRPRDALIFALACLTIGI